MTNENIKAVNHGFYANMFWREHHFLKKGEVHKGHTHVLDHVTILIKGSVEAKIDNNEPIIINAPSIIEIDKDKYHQFTSLEDDTIYFCVFATNDITETISNLDAEQIKEVLKDKLCVECEGCKV